MNNGPLGKSLRNFPIRRVSTIEAFTAPTTPPLTKPSSKLVNRKRLKPLSTVLISTYLVCLGP